MVKKHAAIYCRVSTQDQTNLNQRIVLERYALDHGWDYTVFEEKESSRKTRPVKAALLARLRSKENVFDCIIVSKLDRFARSSTELILDITELLNKGIAFLSLGDNLDFSTASGRLHFHILSAFSEFERSLISERTKIGLNRVKLQGKRLGRPLGSKDKGARKKSGYYLREALKKQKEKFHEYSST